MGKRRFLPVVIVLTVIIAMTACSPRIVGSGRLITETRQVSSFDKIDLSGVGEVIVTQGEVQSLSIETDDNILEHLKISVEGETLKLGFEEGYTNSAPTRLIFTVGANNLTGLTVSGSGNIETASLATDRLDIAVSGSGNVRIADLSAGSVSITISGSGEIDLSGAVPKQEVSITGSGRYLAGDLASETVSVTVSGSGKATVWATRDLEADISGSGTVSYYGNPSLDFSGSGSGNIKDLGER